MQPITYLCFTLLSILIQFSLLDFTNTKDDNEDVLVENTSTAYNKEILKKIKQKPHALYYRTEKNKLLEKANLIFPLKYANVSLTESSFMSSTELESTVFDLLYDDNVSTVDNHFTSDLPFTTTEYDNVTEITFFEKSSTPKPTDIPKKITTLSNCDCNLLHTICDINCCCDDDCTEKEKSMFTCTIRSRDTCTYYNKYQKYLCHSELTCKDRQTSYFFQNLFCIDKVNLPEKQTKTTEKYSSPNISSFYTWEKNEKHEDKHEFTKEMYVSGQSIWVLTNRELNVIELPIMVINNYCSGKKAVKYLQNEELKCLVKLQDLHMLNILKSFEETHIVSPTTNTFNNTVMNCSSLHCVNWTVLVCDEINCVPYNKSVHEPTCSERYCSNIAVKLNYLFYCNASNITKALIKLHVTRVSMTQQVVQQEINVNFYMTNHSIDNVVQLSGNPGYIKGLPLIASYLKNNHTKYFYNNTDGNKNHISVPVNKNGDCFLSNTTENVLIFGHNKRMKCRLSLKKSLRISNGTDECLKIQEQVKKLLGVNVKVFISPYGNPFGVEDDKWLGLELLNSDVTYGEYRPKSSKLLCFNLITSVSFIITFADTNGVTKNENKILSARVAGGSENVVLDTEYLSVVITIDTNFINVRSLMIESVDGINLKFHPSHFLPLPSNKCSSSQSYALLIYMCYVMFK